jgi:hypothetical protein
MDHEQCSSDTTTHGLFLENQFQNCNFITFSVLKEWPVSFWRTLLHGIEMMMMMMMMMITNISIEIHRIWNTKRFVIPVIIGPTGVVIEGLKKSVNNTRKAFNRFCTKSSCTRDIEHINESATI